jgi:hypothetical protein
MEYVKRTVSTSFMVALVVAALFLGNCLTCPQVLMAIAAHHAPHGCCHRNQPASTGCHTQLLQQFVKTGSGTPAPALAVTVMVAAQPAVSPIMLPAATLAIPPAPTPPDLLALNASFRI